jgi:hypothetical protein
LQTEIAGGHETNNRVDTLRVPTRWPTVEHARRATAGSLGSAPVRDGVHDESGEFDRGGGSGHEYELGEDGVESGIDAGVDAGPVWLAGGGDQARGDGDESGNPKADDPAPSGVKEDVCGDELHHGGRDVGGRGEKCVGGRAARALKGDGAGDGARTHDVQLGKLAFYH